MASHPIWCALKYSGTFNDVTTDVHQPSVLRITRGAQDETGGIKPSTTALTLKDIDTAAPKYDPDHPLSPLYGVAGRNTHLLLGAQIVQETFESATPAIARTDAGSAFWARSTTDAHTGTWSLKAGTITNSQVSDFTINTPAGANAVSIWYKVSAQTPGDGLQILVDGTTTVVNLAGVNPWLQVVVRCNPGGTIRFRYTKDASGSAGADTAWVDDITYYYGRSMVEISSWAPDQSETFAVGSGFRSTAIEGAGLLQRIGRWKDAIRSVVFRQISGRLATGRLIGYWPMEDKVGSTGLTNAVPGGQPGLATGVTYEGGQLMSGSDLLIKMGTSARMSGRFLKPTGTPNGWQLSWTMQLDAPGLPLEQPMITWTTTNGYRWYFTASDTVYNIKVVAQDGITVLLSTGVTYTGSDDPVATPLVFRVICSAAAGTVTANYSWYAQDSPTFYGSGGSFTGTTGALASWASNGNPLTDGMTFGQVYGVSDSIDDLEDYATSSAFNGYRGERAGDRFLRLMSDAGLVALMIGNTSDTQPMGPQKSGRLFDLLKEVQVTEDGPMFDAEFTTAVYFRTRQSMYHQTPKLTLTRSQCAPPLRKVTDDLVTGNSITVRNRSGGEATVSITSGPGSTQDPPLGVGEYEQTIDVNVASDDDLDEIAGWWANKLSDTTARYPQVTVDLDAQPGLEAAVNTVQIGDRIVLSDVIPGGVGLIVLGYTETWTTQFRKMITFNCAPDTVFNPAVYDAAATDYDSVSTTLAVARDTVQTSWSITTTAQGDTWSTAGVPYGWIVAGEQMTVTAMTAAAGTGPYTQTATVTRSVNGVVKAHAVGEEIHISPRARYAR